MYIGVCSLFLTGAIYDIVDPSKTICADFYSQGNTKSFRQNASKQCVVMYLTVIIYNEITNINAWDSSSLNIILSVFQIRTGLGSMTRQSHLPDPTVT